jgi:arylsulfatase
MNKPYRGSKALLWEGGPKTAFIARWPGHIQAGSISDTVGWVGDLLPTCLGVAGASYPSEFRGAKTSPPEGRNLLPALNGSPLAPPEFIFTNDKGQQGVIHQGRWKLLINSGWYQITSQKPGVTYELYDLSTDLAETKDLSKEQPERVKQLAEACTAWQAKNGIVDYGELLKTRPDFSK